MSAVLMDASIAAALEAGRSVIAPSPQRAAALRWNWARVQRERGLQVWSTPDVLTWDAWLDARWEQSQRLGRPTGLRRLNRSQQRRLWERVLRELAPGFAPGEDLAPHASALMDAAGEATQYLLNLPRLAVSDEERLLVAAMAGVQSWCERHDSIILPLALPETLAGFLQCSPPPLLAGQRSATPLQQRVSGLCWQGASLLPEPGPDETGTARLVRATTLDAELQACAQWCRRLLEEDSARRLLVVSGAGNPSLAMQAQVLWRELARGTASEALPVDHQLLAVEGGQRLDHHALVADALAALRLLDGDVSWSDLSQLLRSPYLEIGSQSGMLQLERALAAVGTARWSRAALDRTLRRLDATCPAANMLAQWLRSPAAGETQQAPALAWAARFSEWLGAAGFARAAALDSGDAQRLRRWSELLDEFAALDAVLAPQSPAAALSQLQKLAGETVHAAESGDAAITLTAQRVAPLACYDGIWVLGLTEQRWPEPPRPDPYVPLSEQRRGGWDAAGARQRLEQARWTQWQWQRATSNLVLSHAQQEGDLRLRPSALLLAAGTREWHEVQEQAPDAGCSARIAPRGRLPRHQGDAGRPLTRGLLRLRLQQACAFRSQAETRLGAAPPSFISDGIHPAVRGQLLHAVLERLWQELGSQEQLLRLDETARRALVVRHWTQALRAMEEAGGPVYTARLLSREQDRTERLILRVLQMDAGRPPFQVVEREQKLPLATPGGVISLRIDRVDADAAGRWLIDYKSGAPETIRLEQGSAQPLQLALYEQALAGAGLSVKGVTLLSLSPAVAGYYGAAADPTGWPGKWKHAADWEAVRQQWQAEVSALLLEHLEGRADVAPLRDACRLCHLAGLCRRGEPLIDDSAEADDE